MPIFNIVDHRKHPYRFKKINVVVEATWHDNRVRDHLADQVPTDKGPDYEEKEHITLAEALSWGESFSTPVTLFLYDEDAGIYVHTEGKDDKPYPLRAEEKDDVD
jgi:hypothetical protein